MLEIILISATAFLAVACVVLLIIIRGMINFRQEEIDGAKITSLTGREIEAIRRKIIHSGRQDLSYSGALSLVKTLQDIQLGAYEDTDPYVPADPYEGI